MTHSTIEAPASISGGLPVPGAQSASITVTERRGDSVTVTSWDTCTGISEFVKQLLAQHGPPTAHAETIHREAS